MAVTITLNMTSEEPLYQQIVQQVRLQVLQGKLKDGDQLPSIRVLARELQVSVITTKRAYEELEREGLLASSAGRGSFVRAKGIEASKKGQMEELSRDLARSASQARVLGLDREEFTGLAGRLYQEEGPKKNT